MAFIPAADVLRVGDRIRITEPLELLNGTFTVGHEFTIMSYGGRGFDLQDDDGRENVASFSTRSEKCARISEIKRSTMSNNSPSIITNRSIDNE